MRYFCCSSLRIVCFGVGFCDVTPYVKGVKKVCSIMKLFLMLFLSNTALYDINDTDSVLSGPF